jgi:hypothetical protein
MVASRTPGELALTPNDEAPAVALHEGLFRRDLQFELEHQSIVRVRSTCDRPFRGLWELPQSSAREHPEFSDFVRQV